MINPPGSRPPRPCAISPSTTPTAAMLQRPSARDRGAVRRRAGHGAATSTSTYPPIPASWRRWSRRWANWRRATTPPGPVRSSARRRPIATMYRPASTTSSSVSSSSPATRPTSPRSPRNAGAVRVPVVAALTGLPVANASMYDGSTACAEAVMMAARVTRRGEPGEGALRRPAPLAEACWTLAHTAGIETARWRPSSGLSRGGRDIDADTACVVVQTPNVFAAR